MSEERGVYNTGPVGEEQEIVGLEIEGLEICQWHPTENSDDSAPEQVHLIIKIGGDGPIDQLVFRFKGPKTLDQLIDQMVMHRTEVWGARGTGFAAQS